MKKIDKKTLIITEKPSVARDIAKALGKFENKKDYLENEKYVITWALGHLVTLYEPSDYDKKLKFWTLQSLPIIPEEFKFKPIKETKKRFNAVKKLINRKDIAEIVNACDAGREGELIFRNILRLVPPKNKKLKRLWLSAMTKEEILNGFKNLYDSEKFDLLGESATARMESDWLVGINATRAFTRRWGTILSIGRVQTPTLNIICSREKEIKAFKSEKYFEIQGQFDGKEKYSGLYIDKKRNSRISSKEKAEEIKSKTEGKEGTIQKVKKSLSKRVHPLLYDLTELQRDANRKFGYSAKRTLNIAQSLYESRKLITYPRTDSRYLPKALKSELPKILKGIKVKPYEMFVNEILSKPIKLDSRVINDKGVSDHYAIIPTGNINQLGALSKEETNIFDLITRRFLSVFYENAIIEKLDFVTNVEKEIFKTSLSRLKEPGWMKVYNGVQKSELMDIKNGDKAILQKVEIAEKETQPPPRFTDATILTAMETAGKLVEDEELREAMKERGLGTPATRAGIIERLIEVEYIEREGKSLKPLDKGLRLIELVTQVGTEEILSPSITGDWEKKLRDIEKGKLKAEKFMSDIKEFTKEIVQKVKDYKGEYSIKAGNTTPVGKCPKCGADVYETPKTFECENKKSGKCDFVIWKKFLNKTLTRETVEKLLNGEKVHLTKLRGRNKFYFDADILLDKDGNITFDGMQNIKNDKPISDKPVGKCPKCGADVLEGTYSYFCSKKDEGCTFYIKKTMGNMEIDRETASELLKNKKTKLLTGFTSKKGKPFSAYLYIDKNGTVRFEFENKKATRTKKKSKNKK
jgi:DNA topoisomerase-3